MTNVVTEYFKYFYRLAIYLLTVDNLDLYRPYSGTISHIGVPWYNVMVNHDMNFDVKSDSLADETFEVHFGPANYSFHHGMVHLIIPDDIIYPDPSNGKGYRGGFREDQFEIYAPRVFKQNVKTSAGIIAIFLSGVCLIRFIIGLMKENGIDCIPLKHSILPICII